MSIVTRLNRSVQKLARRARLTADEAILVGDVVRGICEKKSCHLSEIARVCREDVPLRATERRLSDGLAAEDATLDKLPDAWLGAVAPTANRFPYIAVDLSEISKPHGRAFEHLDWVRDASDPERRITPGFWLITITAHDAAHAALPLWLSRFSTKDPAYAGWFETIFDAIKAVRAKLGAEATWLFDRGFDGDANFRDLDALVARWVVRLRSNRDIDVGDERAPQRWNVRGFATNLRTPHAIALPYIDKAKHTWATMGLSFGYAPVRIEGRTYTLLVVRGTRDEDWILLTRVRVRNAKDAAKLVRAYVARWGAEEWVRCLKQSTGLEDLRVRNWLSIGRLVFLAMLAMGIQALWLATRPQSVQWLLRRIKSFFETVPFLHYRLWAGTADALAHGS